MQELARPQWMAVRLEFRPEGRPPVNLSGAAACGDALFVVGDEGCGVTTLHREPPRASETLRFVERTYTPLAALLALPAADDVEADLEGLAVHDGWLWLVGSHSRKRKSVGPGREDADNADRLAALQLEGNRMLLARIPLEPGDDGEPSPVRHAKDGRKAMRLRGNARRNDLTRQLADDPLLGPSLEQPGKDNGFDVEGLALANGHLLLGLRGPVLAGWTVVLELSPREGRRRLKLDRLAPDGPRLRQHLLQLDGLGVRDLHVHGDDLYLLAGPTMALDGDIRLYRWPEALLRLAENEAPVRFERELHAIATLPHQPGSDRAEGVCALPDGRWLVIYDAPSPERHDGSVVFGDLLDVQGRPNTLAAERPAPAATSAARRLP